jgi:hypothetical protein
LGWYLWKGFKEDFKDRVREEFVVVIQVVIVSGFSMDVEVFYGV